MKLYNWQKFNENIKLESKEDIISTDFGKIEICVTNFLENEEGEKIPLGKNIAIITAIYLEKNIEKNKGYGKQLYMTALNKYKKLYSHFPISEEAFNTRKSLEKLNLVKSNSETFGDFYFLTLELI